MQSSTIVTAYVDATRHYPYAGNKYSREKYLQYFRDFAAHIPVPMVCFAEEDDVEHVIAVRRELGFDAITSVRRIGFDELEFFGRLTLLHETYARYAASGRGVFYFEDYFPAYSVVINSKLELMTRVMDENPFASTHLLWLDFGLRSRGYDYLDIGNIMTIASHPRDKVSFGVIHPSNDDPYEQLMVGWRFVACGGLFTVPIDEHGRTFLQECLGELHHALDLGLYPLEESVFFHLWKRNPDRFDVFYGNYDTLSFRYLDVGVPGTSKRGRREIVAEWTARHPPLGGGHTAR